MWWRNSHKGQVLLLSVVLLAVVFGLSGAFMSYIKNIQVSTNVFSSRSAARNAAQAGIDKTVWCLNQSVGTNCGGTYGASFVGETAVSLNANAHYTTTITSVSGNKKTVTATGYYPSVTSPASVVNLKADITIDTTTASFYYGIQGGFGGIEIANNGCIDGNIYSNGTVNGANGAYVTGDVYVAGGTSLTADQQHTTKNNDYTFGRTSPVNDIAQGFQLSGDNVLNKVTFYIKKVGNPSNVTVRILQNNAGVPSRTVLGTATLTASTVTTSYGWVDASFSTPPPLLGGVTYWLSIDTTANASNYWIIGGDTATGYANGPGMVSTNWNANPPVWSDSGSDFNFKVWTGGVITKVMDQLHVYGDAYANTLDSITVDGDAYYQTKVSTTVGGISYPGSPDLGPQDFPISDSQMQEWKDDATNGGTIVGNYNISGNQSLGPKLITGNLTFTNNATLTLNGTVWVNGSITTANNVIISLASGYGSNSGVFGSDGVISMNNNTQFQGSGTAGSYVMVLSTGTADPTLSLGNNSANSIFYAPNGGILLYNNTSLKEVTGFKLYLSNGACVQYESGLENVSFSSGPSASWALSPGTVREIH